MLQPWQVGIQQSITSPVFTTAASSNIFKYQARAAYRKQDRVMVNSDFANLEGGGGGGGGGNGVM